MAQGSMTVAIGQLDSLLRAGSMAGLSDAELLERVIATDRDAASVAFEALIHRLAGREVQATVPPRLIAATLGSVKLTLAGAGAFTAFAQATSSLGGS